MALRGRARAVTLTALPLGLALFPLAAITLAVGFVAFARPLRPLALAAPALLVWLALVASAASSGRIADAAPTVLLVGLLGALLLLWRTRLEIADVPPILAGFALTLVVLGLRALVEVFVVGESRATAGLPHGNQLGSFVAMSLPLVLSTTWWRGSIVGRTLAIGGGALGLSALVLSGSRGAVVAFVVALLVMALVSRFRGGGRFGPAVGAAAAVAVAAVAASLAVPWLVSGSPTPAGTHALQPTLTTPHDASGGFASLAVVERRLGEGFEGLAPNPLATSWLGPLARRIPLLNDAGAAVPDRPLMWALGLELAALRPFLGYGAGAFPALVPILEPTFPLERYAHVHNLYLHLLLEGGSVLLAASGALALLVGAALARRARQNRDAIAAAALGVFIGGAAHNAVDVLWAQPVLLAVWWLGVAMATVEGT